MAVARDLSPLWEYDHELAGRIVTLKSGGPTMTITAVRLGDDGEPAIFAVVFANSAGDVCKRSISVRCCDLLDDLVECPECAHTWRT